LPSSPSCTEICKRERAMGMKRQERERYLGKRERYLGKSSERYLGKSSGRDMGKTRDMGKKRRETCARKAFRAGLLLGRDLYGSHAA
jgi:hypothetical protein